MRMILCYLLNNVNKYESPHWSSSPSDVTLRLDLVRALLEANWELVCGDLSMFSSSEVPTHSCLELFLTIVDWV